MDSKITTHREGGQTILGRIIVETVRMTNPASSMGSLKSKPTRPNVFGCSAASAYCVSGDKPRGKSLWQERFLLARRQTPVYQEGY